MKKLWILLAFLGVSIAANAQDAKAGAVLDAMSAKYRNLKTFTADFTYGALTPSGKAGRARSGNIAVKGIKFKLNMAGQEIYNNGTEIYSFVKETNEVNVTEYDASADAQFSPANIYSIYKKGYKYTYKGEKLIGGKAHETVELVPLKPDSNLKKLQITLDKSTKTVKNWKLTDGSGKVTVFEVLKFKPNVALQDSYFSFNAAQHPGVEVVDLR
jgi:outer membrane lipoprotein carrier protein